MPLTTALDSRILSSTALAMLRGAEVAAGSPKPQAMCSLRMLEPRSVLPTRMRRADGTSSSLVPMPLTTALEPKTVSSTALARMRNAEVVAGLPMSRTICVLCMLALAQVPRLVADSPLPVTSCLLSKLEPTTVLPT
jgi:hypothetical protein